MRTAYIRLRFIPAMGALAGLTKYGYRALVMISRRSLVGGAAAAAAFATSRRTLAYRGSDLSAPDPFYMPDTGNGSFPAWKRTNNKTPASAALNGCLRNIILLVVGQSQLCNVNPTAYAPTNITKINNFNVLDEACYQATGSLLGCSNYNATTEYGNPATRVADLLITNNICDIVWLITPAIGGTAVAEWDTGSCSQRIAVAVARLAARGIAASQISGVLWGQGESDKDAGTSQASYQASLSSVISKSRTLGSQRLGLSLLKATRAAPYQAQYRPHRPGSSITLLEYGLARTQMR